MSDSSSPDLLTASQIEDVFDDVADSVRNDHVLSRTERLALYAKMDGVRRHIETLEKQLLAVRSVQRYKMGTAGEGSSVWVDPIRDPEGEFVAWEDVATAAGTEP